MKQDAVGGGGKEESDSRNGCHRAVGKICIVMWSLSGTWHHYVFVGSPSFAADNQALMRGQRTRVYVISVQWSVHLPAYIKEARSRRTRMVCPSSLQDLSVQCIVQWCKAVCILAFMPIHCAAAVPCNSCASLSVHRHRALIRVSNWLRSIQLQL